MQRETTFKHIGEIVLGNDLWLGDSIHTKGARRDRGLSIATDAADGRVFVQSAADGTVLKVVIDLEKRPAAAAPAPTEPAPAEPAGE